MTFKEAVQVLQSHNATINTPIIDNGTVQLMSKEVLEKQRLKDAIFTITTFARKNRPLREHYIADTDAGEQLAVFEYIEALEQFIDRLEFGETNDAGNKNTI